MHRIRAIAVLSSVLVTSLASSYMAPSEFEPQDAIWMTWSENGWLGGPPMSDTMIELVKAAAPHVRVRLLYSEWTSWLEQVTATKPQRSAEEARARLIGILRKAGVDVARVDLMYSSWLSGAIQDPGPFFLRDAHGNMAIADYNSWHPRPEVEGLDRRLASKLGLPTVRSKVVSDGGNRQSNGRGTLLVGEAYELRVNPGMTRDEIEHEHLRMHGASKVIWLKHGPRDEDHGRLEDGLWGIGTGGHVDVFARFADARTVLLIEVLEADRARDPILAETHRRMEQNFAILSAATDQDGQPLRILRVPAADPMTASIAYNDLNPLERRWFEGAQSGETITFYLPGSYLNFVIANDTVITAKYWREGRPESMRRKDALALAALQSAFPGRTVVQIDATPLLYDGAGLHCYTRNQPRAAPRPRKAMSFAAPDTN